MTRLLATRPKDYGTVPVSWDLLALTTMTTISTAAAAIPQGLGFGGCPQLSAPEAKPLNP